MIKYHGTDKQVPGLQPRCNTVDFDLLLPHGRKSKGVITHFIWIELQIKGGLISALVIQRCG